MFLCISLLSLFWWSSSLWLLTCGLFWWWVLHVFSNSSIQLILNYCLHLILVFEFVQALFNSASTRHAQSLGTSCTCTNCASSLQAINSSGKSELQVSTSNEVSHHDIECCVSQNSYLLKTLSFIRITSEYSVKCTCNQ